MTLKAQIAADLDAIFYNTDDFAETVTYTPLDSGVGVDVKAIVDYGKGIDSQGADALNTDATMRIQVSSVDIVIPGDGVTIGNETWQVLDAHLIDDGLEWEVIISRITR
jgi:uncharacterized alkaline shock family protein YloU